jgi:hypothetical protein
VALRGLEQTVEIFGKAQIDCKWPPNVGLEDANSKLTVNMVDAGFMIKLNKRKRRFISLFFFLDCFCQQINT